MSDDPATLTYELELDSGVLTWGEALHTVYGYPQAELANSVEWWAEHILPDDAMRLNEAMDKLFDPRVTEWATDYHFCRYDNRYILVRDRAVIERNRQGQALRLHGTIVPIA